MAPPEFRLPNELWGEILKSVADLDDELATLKSFSLTRHAFRGISRRRLFSHISFTPYVAHSDTDAPLLPSPSEMERRVEHLEFLSSPVIAPLVRYFKVHGCRSPCSRLNSETSPYFSDTQYLLLDALFERLARFTGLLRLHAFYIPLTEARMDILSSLPHLSELHVEGCTLISGDHIAPRTLYISDFRVYDRENELAEESWIPLLCPDHLRVLDMTSYPAPYEPRLLVRTAHIIPSFPNVHTLTTNTRTITLSQNLPFMSKFPRIRILKLPSQPGARVETVSLEARAVFPQLEEYYGPCHALSLFLAAATLRRVQTEYTTSPEHFLTRIQVVQGLKITSLNVTSERLDNTAFNRIVDALPQLTELLLTLFVDYTYTLFEDWLDDDAEPPEDEILHGKRKTYWDGIRCGFTLSAFFPKLADAPFLPPGLKRLAINWECLERDSNQCSLYKLPDFPRLRDALVARCPGLRWLWFHGVYFAFEWRDVNTDGTVREYIAKTFEDAREQRKHADIFDGWEDI
ncbi:hypothetical protein C8R45DRAFT_1222816 [Mycena sanguinolenta]|nr:hypothetical protein C8R45DRAFT_1222816 [Mycena sanguinolenta]